MTFQQLEDAVRQLVQEIKDTNKGLENEAAMLHHASTIFHIECSKVHMEIATIVEEMNKEEAE